MIFQWIANLRGRWANLHHLWRLAIVLAVLAGGWLFGVKPAYRWFKGWRVERNLGAAEVAVANAQMAAARDLSLTVLRAGDPRIDAYRILEKSMASLGDPMHVEISRALMGHPESSDEDRLNGFRGVVPEAPLGLVGQAWATLSPRCQQRPDFAVLFAQRLIAGHRESDAATVLLSVPEAARTAEVERGLIRVLLGSRKQEGTDEAQRRIAAQWPAPGASMTAWLELLEEIPIQILRADLLAPVRRALAQEGAAEPVRRALALARLEYAANFPGRAAVIDQVIAKWQTDEPLEVARFLRALGLFQRLLTVFPPAVVATRPGLLPDVLEALEETEAWAEVKRLLEGADHLMPTCEIRAHQAVAAGKTGEVNVQIDKWDAAMADAKFSTAPDAYLKLSRIAQTRGLQREAAEAMVAAVLRGRGPLPLYAEIGWLNEWLVKQERESSLLQVCAIYLQFEPGNPTLLTRYAYLACLNHQVVPSAMLKAIKPMAEAFPDELPMQCVLAVAYLCNDEPTAAAKVLDRLKVDFDQLAPAYRVAFLATQVRNERMSPKDPRITGFPWQALLPSERKQFAEWLKAEEP